jgi:formate-dependent nitrite reductase membrane component NrfD
MLELISKELPWGIYIALALFFGGMGGGSFIVAAVTSAISGEEFREILKFGAYIGLLATALCGIFLSLHAGHPERLLYMYSNPTSMITFGATMITSVLFVGLIYATFLPPDSLPWLKSFLPWSVYVKPRKFFELLLFILGSGLAGYTGFVLALARAEPFWETPLITALFYTSGVSTALMAIGLCIAVLRLVQVTEESRKLFVEMMHRLDVADGYMLLIEFGVAMLYVYTMLNDPSKVARASAEALVFGELAPLFWGGFVFLGLIIPLLLLVLLAWKGRTAAFIRLYAPLMMLAALCVLAGGAIMRFCFLAAGQLPVVK